MEWERDVCCRTKFSCMMASVTAHENECRRRSSRKTTNMTYSVLFYGSSQIGLLRRDIINE